MIRKVDEKDRQEYLKMAEAFYQSEAVNHTVDSKFFEITFNEIMASDTYAEAYVFEKDNEIAGYALLAKTFSQEAGGATCWVEEIYVKPDFRSRGIATEFFSYLNDNIGPSVKRFRLEVTEDNKNAISLYKKQGYRYLPYIQMILEKD